MRWLENVQGVVTALGGPEEAMRLLGLRRTAVYNWLAQGRIPPRHTFAIDAILRPQGFSISPIVFGHKAELATA